MPILAWDRLEKRKSDNREGKRWEPLEPTLPPTTTAQSAPRDSWERPLVDGLLSAACAGTGQRAAFCLRLQPSTVPAHLQTGAVFTNSRCPHSLLPPFLAQRTAQLVHGGTSTALTPAKTPKGKWRGALEYFCSPNIHQDPHESTETSPGVPLQPCEGLGWRNFGPGSRVEHMQGGTKVSAGRRGLLGSLSSFRLHPQLPSLHIAHS